ncbi:unnamed protein product, partial [Musa textilis]
DPEKVPSSPQASEWRDKNAGSVGASQVVQWVGPTYRVMLMFFWCTSSVTRRGLPWPIRNIIIDILSYNFSIIIVSVIGNRIGFFFFFERRIHLLI